MSSLPCGLELVNSQGPFWMPWMSLEPPPWKMSSVVELTTSCTKLCPIELPKVPNRALLQSSPATAGSLIAFPSNSKRPVGSGLPLPWPGGVPKRSAGIGALTVIVAVAAVPAAASGASNGGALLPPPGAEVLPVEQHDDGHTHAGPGQALAAAGTAATAHGSGLDWAADFRAVAALRPGRFLERFGRPPGQGPAGPWQGGTEVGVAPLPGDEGGFRSGPPVQPGAPGSSPSLAALGERPPADPWEVFPETP